MATLGALIETLESLPQDAVIPDGFARPHSYRGVYEELAFEPQANTVVRDMLAEARGALGQVFDGWKGGEYKMYEWTPVHLANRGDTSEDYVCLRCLRRSVEAP